jgi:hypothetical protein
MISEPTAKTDPTRGGGSLTMTRNELQDLKDAEPFRPFTLVTAARRYRVDHPDYLLFPPLPTPGSPREWPDYVEAFAEKSNIPAFVTIAHIIGVEFHAEAEKQTEGAS